MRGINVRSFLFAQRIRPTTHFETAKNTAETNNLFQSDTKSWLNSRATPMWRARLRRQVRQFYRDTVAWRMFLTSKAFYRIEIRGLENYTYTPSTIIACGHKRDMDLPIIIPRLFKRSGSQPKTARRSAFKLMFVAARDDVFEAGFLMVYFPILDFLRPVLGRVSLERLFYRIQACPVKLPDEQTVSQLLHETKRLEGNLPVEEALDPEWQTRLLVKPGLTLHDAIYNAPLKVLTQYATPRLFREPLASRIRQRHYTTTVQQLHYITRILEKGGTLIVLPEGRVTPDGRFCKMRAAVTRLALQTRTDTTMLPVNLTYDFMDTLRPNVTMLVGPEIKHLKSLAKNELAEQIRRLVIRLTCVNFSGLVSRQLVEAAESGLNQLEIEQLRLSLWQEVQRLQLLGLPLDRQLATRQEFELRLQRFLKYIQTNQVGLSHFAGSHTLHLNREKLLQEDCRKFKENPVRYCYNELTELLESYKALPPELSSEPANIPDFSLALAK